MKKLIAIFLLLSCRAYADELITDFDAKSIPILNEELRNLHEEIDTVSDSITTFTPSTTNALAGSVVQTVSYQTGAVDTGTTTIPGDDSIPEITEGDEYMTLAITPTSATNKLLIKALANVATTANGYPMVMGLFQDSTTNALAATVDFVSTSGANTQICLTHYMTAGTTSSTTFRIRIGCTNAGTTTFNGVASGRYFGGVMASSITIQEVKV